MNKDNLMMSLRYNCELLYNEADSGASRQLLGILFDLLDKAIPLHVTHNDRGYFCTRCHKQQKSPDPKRPHLKFYCTRCGQRLTHNMEV